MKFLVRRKISNFIFALYIFSVKTVLGLEQKHQIRVLTTIEPGQHASNHGILQLRYDVIKYNFFFATAGLLDNCSTDWATQPSFFLIYFIYLFFI